MKRSLNPTPPNVDSEGTIFSDRRAQIVHNPNSSAPQDSRSFRLIVAIVLLLSSFTAVGTQPAGAEGGPAVTHADATTDLRANTVLRGTISAVSSIELIDGRLFTVSTVSVDTVLRGEADSTVRVLTEGGRAKDGTRQSTSAQAHLEGGQRYQLYLIDLPSEVTGEVGVQDAENLLGVVGHQGALLLGSSATPGEPLVEDSDAAGDFVLSQYNWITHAPEPIPYSMNIASLPVGGAYDAVRDGMQAWIDQAGPLTLSFSYVGNTGISERSLDGNNVIFWADTPNPADTYLARTSVWFTSNGASVEMDVQFNNDYLWATVPTPGRYDIQSVTTHEAGHVIGLSHVGAISEVMYPSQGSNSTKRNLGSGDISGVESLYGAAVCGGLEATITGTAGDDYLVGSAGDDIILGGSGNDIIDGKGGDDIICGAAGADTVFGGAGNDTIYGGTGADELHGGEGNDTIKGEGAGDVIRGDNGNDLVYGGSGDDNIKTGKGDDTIYGESGADDISGNGGSDSIFGGDGSDDLSGGKGSDYLDGGPGDDVVGGGSGADEVHGGDDDDVVQGRPGNDLVYGDEGDDILKGNNGKDTLIGGNGSDTGNGGGANDIVHGGPGNDHFSGGKGNDSVYGDDGDDIVKGGSGDDIVEGSAGNDTVSGGKGNDTLFGGEGDDQLSGGQGTDVLTDSLGSNTLDGGNGSDTCTPDGQNCELFA